VCGEQCEKVFTISRLSYDSVIDIINLRAAHETVLRMSQCGRSRAVPDTGEQRRTPAVSAGGELTSVWGEG
jgi:hypothetical protein